MILGTQGGAAPVVSNQEAADALCNGAKCVQPPVHPAMVNMATVLAEQQDPAANVTDAAPDDGDD
jgi:hypothetical protein